MDPRDPLPADPYAALGVPRDASQATIKTAYRKAALKCHPDKVPGKGDEFHRISVAYELIGEEESRSKYDADVRLRELKKEQQARFGGGGYPASPGVRTAAFDVRGSPRPGFQFSERTAPRYETSERRPPPQYASTPKATPYERESSRGDYFGRYEAYDAPPPRKTSGTKTPFREEERKPSSKKEKVDPKQKMREETKKTRDKTRGYDRKTKAESIVDSDSESEDDRSRRSRQENVRAAYVRPKKESSRRSDDDDKDYFSRRQENMRTYSVKDYISKAKTDGPPIEKGAPPPAYATNGNRRQARSPSPSPPLRERERDDDIRSSKVRPSRGEPEVVRRSSDKSSKEKEKPSKKESAKSTSARPAVSRMASGRRSPPPERDHRPTSRLQHADTAPPSRLYIPEDAEIRRGKAEAYRQEEARGAPPMRRSETVPKPSRHGDATPIQSSGLRNVKTNDDSGYSTSSPSEDTPPQPAKQYRYEADREERVRPSMRDRRESNRSPERDLDRDRRLPSEKERDRARGPPVSRSGSYAFDVRNSDPEPRPAGGRRPSLQRRGSLRDDPPPRRVPLERADSMRGSSSRVPQVVPDLPRGKTMPTVRTGFNDLRDRSSSDTRYFGEIPHVSSSPVNAHSDDSDFDELPSRMRRGIQRDIPHRHVMRDMDSGYGTSYGPPQGRRASEDYEKMRMDGAARYMEQATERPLPRRNATYAGMG